MNAGEKLTGLEQVAPLALSTNSHRLALEIIDNKDSSIR